MGKSIENRASFEIIRYSNCWEDADILYSALCRTSGLKYLSISSSGDNSFALLASDPELVVACDLSSVQNSLVELRKIAFTELEYENMLKFLGFRYSNERLKFYDVIKKHLSQPSRDYFDQNSQIIKNGVIYCGKFENFFRIFRRYILPLIHSRNDVVKLLEKNSFQEQEEFYDRTWNSVRWRLLFKVFFSRFVMGRLGRDPEFFKYVETDVAGRIFSRAEYAFTKLSTNGNPYLNFIMTGEFNDALPFYVRPENFERIRNNIEKLKIFNGPVQDAAAYYNCRFDGFNMSDIFEYMDVDLFREISSKLIGSASKGARFAYWNMLVERRISTLFPEKLLFREQESRENFLRDKAFFYKSFYIDEKK